MFSSFFKKNPLADLREQAEALRRSAHKVWCYRKDVISAGDADELQSAEKELARIAGEKDAGENEFKNALENLDRILRHVGGSIYPARMIPEWVELIVVAAIIAGGVRAFFLQPFKIPTNSMYPTYHGMTAQVYPLDQDGASGVKKVFLKLTQWASRVESRTPVAGEVEIPANIISGNGVWKIEPDGGILGTGLLRGSNYVYYVMVGNERVPISVPQDFSLQSVILKTYFPEEAAMVSLSEPARWEKVLENAKIRKNFRQLPTGEILLRTHRMVAAGDRVANFDILTGDMVLVDRMSYNFVRPSVGDSFVFATKNISGLNKPDGTPNDQYYIKRLVGLPGDTLQVKPPVLFRNNEPIAGKPAFEKNNALKTDAQYFGYLADCGGRYSVAQPRTLPEQHYFAMGDNSANSWDSRGWGYVPESEIIGRALWILYPFTNRWGLAE